MFSTLRNAWRIPDIKKKILYTLLMVLVYRLGSAIPVPGIDVARLNDLFKNEEGFLGLFNLVSGGNFKQFTVFALGIGPYITASIVLNLLQMAIPSLEALAREGEVGRKKIAQYTRYLTIVLAIIQGIGFSFGLFRPVFLDGGSGMSILIAVITLTAGTAVMMYLGEKVTEKGIGNGISLFIFAGIVASIPGAVLDTVQKLQQEVVNIFAVIAFAVVSVVVVMGIVFIQQGTRKIPVQHAKKVVGRKVYGGNATHIPLKVNQAGVIPIIFAISLLMVPMIFTQFFPESGYALFMKTYFGSTSIAYNVLYVLLIIGFTYFYTSVTFNPVEIADRLKTSGGFVPGIRPGKPTSDFLTKTVNRISFAGAVFLAVVAVIPNILSVVFPQMRFGFGGTSLLILVSVALETMKQIEAQMMMRHYEGFLD